MLSREQMLFFLCTSEDLKNQNEIFQLMLALRSFLNSSNYCSISGIICSDLFWTQKFQETDRMYSVLSQTQINNLKNFPS